MATPKVCKAFKNGLHERGLTFEDVKKWEFCGGCGESTNHFLYFKKCFPNHELPEFKKICVCGQILYVNNGYIRKDQTVLTPDEATKEFLIIGICCTDHFLETGISRLCDTCKQPHKSHYATVGNTCRKCREILKKDQKQFKKLFKNVTLEILHNGNFEIKNPKVREAKARAERLAAQKAAKDAAEKAAAEKEKKRLEYDNAKIIYFDFPHSFNKDYLKTLKDPLFNDCEKERNKFTYYPELKIWFCRNTAYFRKWVAEHTYLPLSLNSYVIKNIDDFRHKRDTNHRAEYNIKSIMLKLNLPFNETVNYIKKLGYYFDGDKKLWYKQY
jgi:ribosomal protein L17